MEYSKKKTILAESSFCIEKVDEDLFSVQIVTSTNEPSPIIKIELEKHEPRNEKYLKNRAASVAIGSYMEALETDMKQAHLLNGPLASTIWSHERAISAMGSGLDPFSVAFNVSFPTLENVPINELISIRLENGDAFQCFRDALTRAAREMCAISRGASYGSLAEQIKSDIINPEINRLNKRMKSAQESIVKKAVGTIALSAIGTLCAASMGIVPAAAAGTVLAASAIANLNKDFSKFIDDKNDIKLSNMYFIWKALDHAD